ncbi:MAG: hypothetical protein DME74_08665 [Verrucomicrobia bacterium]|nr:MAG: hypothetical protein DME74_08665 [Verrucomicrobiota bacterium]
MDLRCAPWYAWLQCRCSWNRGALLEIGLNENAQTSASRLVPLILEDGFPRIDAAMESNTSETSKAFAVGK